jgi:hypothetical protein
MKIKIERMKPISSNRAVSELNILKMETTSLSFKLSTEIINPNPKNPIPQKLNVLIKVKKIFFGVSKSSDKIVKEPKARNAKSSLEIKYSVPFNNMENAIAVKINTVNTINLFSLLGSLLSLKVEIMFLIILKSNSLFQFKKIEFVKKMTNGILFIDIISGYVI